LTWAYDQAEEPPAPFLEISVYHPENIEQVAQIRAKLDTGADISAIPTVLITQLALPIVSRILIEGYDGHLTTVASYAVSIQISDVLLVHQEVISIPDPYVLLGRDVLNRFFVQLNGPDLTFNLSRTPFQVH
jgi:hypothetical protein